MAHVYRQQWHKPSQGQAEASTSQALGEDELVRPAGLENTGPSPNFAVFARLLDRIAEEGRKKPGKKTKGGKPVIVKEFFEVYRQKVGLDLFPVLRLLLPARDNRRKQYNLKEQKLAKAYIKVMELAPNGDDAHRLNNWKLPTPDNPGAGDFATVLYEVIKTRSSVTQGSMTIDDINGWLDRITNINGWKQGTPYDKKPKRGSQVDVVALLRELWQNTTPNEQKYVIKIILRDLKLGIGENGILPQIHPDAPAVFNASSDLARVSWTLADPNTKVTKEDTTVSIGAAFRPMLSLRNQRDLNDIVKAMTSGRHRVASSDEEERLSQGDKFFYSSKQFIIEEKMDGERIQLHMATHPKTGQRSFKYFSRKSISYGYLYGEHAKIGSLTPRIVNHINKDIKELILDGEMVAYDPSLGKVLPFGDLKTYAKASSFNAIDPRPCFKVFDVLHIGTSQGSTSLLNTPLARRRQLLETKVFSPPEGVPNVIEIALTEKCFSVDCIQRFLGKVIHERGEGIIVKNPSSLYQLGGRTNAWIKAKPDYFDSLGESIECVVIGGYWGKGPRTSGRFSSFLAAIVDDRVPEVDGQPVCVTLAKVGSGLSLFAYNRIIQDYGNKFYDFDPRNRPGWLRTGIEVPDQLILPTDSFVLNVQAAEIIIGADFGAGLTLRFPRSKWLETEKTIEDVFTLDQIHELRADVKHRPAVGRTFAKKVKRNNGTLEKASAMSSVVAPPPSPPDQHPVPALFEGLTFFVYRLAPEHPTKEEVQAMIEQAGGKFIQKIPGQGQGRRVVASNLNGAELSRVGAKGADILSVEWVLGCVKQGTLLPRTARYYLQVVEDGTEDSTEFNLEAELKRHRLQHDQAEMAAAEGWDFLTKDEMDEDDEDVKPDLTKVKLESPKLSTRFHSVADPRFAVPRGVDDGSEPETDAEGGGGGVRLVELSSEDDSGGEEGEAEGDWVMLPASAGSTTSTHVKVGSSPVEAGARGLSGASPGMGDEAAGAEVGAVKDEFGEERPWGPLVMYFDSEANAGRNGLAVEANEEAAVVRQRYRKLAQAEKRLLATGGRSTSNLLDPTLTHIIVSPGHQIRFTQLVQKTRKPRLRKLVGLTWILDCVENIEMGGGVIDEDGYRV